MDYTLDMNLVSNSGYSMPFGKEMTSPVEITLEYGEQKHPQTGETFFHEGTDFVCKNQTLFALATGVVSGIVSDRKMGFQIISTYGDYDVTYRPVIRTNVNVGQNLRAGDAIAISGDFLHIGVRYKGEKIDPMVFLSMIFGNKKVYSPDVTKEGMEIPTLDEPIKTKYDKYANEINDLAERSFLSYLSDIYSQSYMPREDVLDRILGTCKRGLMDGITFEKIPSMLNPLGLGSRCIDFVSQIKELLLSDFLRYLLLVKGHTITGMTEEEKQNFLMGQGDPLKKV